MLRAVILGGTGAIGRATAQRLSAAGWQVEITGRSPEHVPEALRAAFRAADRRDPDALAAVIAGGADLLVDAAAYTAADARMLLPHLPSIGATVLVSSKAVYVDDEGRHSNSAEPPRFAGPVAESQPTLAPREDLPYDSADGYGPNKVAAERVLLDSGHPVTVLRPSKIHGAGSGNPREWPVVARVLAKRRAVLLRDGGRGVDHPSAAANIAALIETVSRLPGSRVLNIADPDAPSALDIVRTIARHFGHEWREVAVPGDAPVGATPWDSWPPRILDTSAAEALGYRPVGTYAETVGAELDWLADAARRRAAGAPAHPGDPRVEPLHFGTEDDYLGEKVQ